jgi:hypothetical protein
MKAMVWELVNSPAFITAVASVVVYILNKVFDKRPSWAKYEGTIIAAVRHAEKAIPNNSENKSLNRLDAALKYALTVIESREQRVMTEKERAQIIEGIQIVHDRSEV